MKRKTILYIGITLILSSLFNAFCLFYIVKKEKEPKVILPENYHLVTEQDSLKATYRNDSLIIEFASPANR